MQTGRQQVEPTWTSAGGCWWSPLSAHWRSVDGVRCPTAGSGGPIGSAAAIGTQRRRWLHVGRRGRPTRCGCTQTPLFAIAAYTDASWIAVTAMPCPIGTFPIVEPDQYDGSSPWFSPGKSMPVGCAEAELLDPLLEPRLAEQLLAIVTVPTFDERCRICATVIVSVPRGSASWMRRSATWIEYGSVNFVRGVTSPSESAPAIVTTLKTEPGSNASLTAWFRCTRAATLGNLFAS